MRRSCGAAPGRGATGRSAAWLPLSRTSGTDQPRNVAGRVYCGSSSRPRSPKLSVTGLVSLPIAPGSSRVTASITTQAAGLAAREHDVADAELAVDEVLAHAMVDALVAAAQQGEAVAGRPARRQPPGRSGARPARAGTTAAAARPPRPRRRSARPSSASRPRHRTGRRRPCGGRRWCARGCRGSAGRGCPTGGPCRAGWPSRTRRRPPGRS